jgi:hypothetical protein
VSAAEARDGNVWLAFLSYSCAAAGGAHVALAVWADEASEFSGDVDAVSAGYAAGEVSVALGSFWVCALEPLGEVEEYPDPLAGDSFGVFGHITSREVW